MHNGACYVQLVFWDPQTFCHLSDRKWKWRRRCSPKPFLTQDYHLVSSWVHTAAGVLILVSLTFLCGFARKKKNWSRKRQPDAPTSLCSCVGTEACFLGGLACVLGLRWECFCFVKLIHTPGPRSAGWQHHLPGLKDGKREKNDVVRKLIPCWQPLCIVLKGVAWVLWKGRSVVVDENILSFSKVV